MVGVLLVRARLNKALKAFPETKFEIEHVPFQLNTDMPKEGIEREQVLRNKIWWKRVCSTNVRSNDRRG